MQCRCYSTGGYTVVSCARSIARSAVQQCRWYLECGMYYRRTVYVASTFSGHIWAQSTRQDFQVSRLCGSIVSWQREIECRNSISVWPAHQMQVNGHQIYRCHLKVSHIVRQKDQSICVRISTSTQMICWRWELWFWNVRLLHDFLLNENDLFQQMLTFDHRERLPAATCLNHPYFQQEPLWIDYVLFSTSWKNNRI